ncbi:hypothetical protein PIB30_093984 [Stylosanthes scabra]|uniref:Uncharacterized protein n=1 Tax=Stylosanthes scabra TaxID=79078 RepID=A0ABU6YT03_9FABA|nr:hypothetical protein [Stylosanthes scabra]
MVKNLNPNLIFIRTLLLSLPAPVGLRHAPHTILHPPSLSFHRVKGGQQHPPDGATPFVAEGRQGRLPAAASLCGHKDKNFNAFRGLEWNRVNPKLQPQLEVEELARGDLVEQILLNFVDLLWRALERWRAGGQGIWGYGLWVEF